MAQVVMVGSGRFHVHADSVAKTLPSMTVTLKKTSHFLQLEMKGPIPRAEEAVVTVSLMVDDTTVTNGLRSTGNRVPLRDRKEMTYRTFKISTRQTEITLEGIFINSISFLKAATANKKGLDDVSQPRCHLRVTVAEGGHEVEFSTPRFAVSAHLSTLRKKNSPDVHRALADRKVIVGRYDTSESEKSKKAHRNRKRKAELSPEQAPISHPFVSVQPLAPQGSDSPPATKRAKTDQVSHPPVRDPVFDFEPASDVSQPYGSPLSQDMTEFSYKPLALSLLGDVEVSSDGEPPRLDQDSTDMYILDQVLNLPLPTDDISNDPLWLGLLPSYHDSHYNPLDGWR